MTFQPRLSHERRRDRRGCPLLARARNHVVVNSCTLAAAADRDTPKAVSRARREHPDAALVLMGCYVDAHPGDTFGADVVVPNAWKQAPAQPRCR